MFTEVFFDRHVIQREYSRHDHQICREVWVSFDSVLTEPLNMQITLIFSARCNIYISRLCYDVSVRLSVCDGSALAHYS